MPFRLGEKPERSASMSHRHLCEARLPGNQELDLQERSPRLRAEHRYPSQKKSETSELICRNVWLSSRRVQAVCGTERSFLRQGWSRARSGWGAFDRRRSSELGRKPQQAMQPGTAAVIASCLRGLFCGSSTSAAMIDEHSCCTPCPQLPMASGRRSETPRRRTCPATPILL